MWPRAGGIAERRARVVARARVVFEFDVAAQVMEWSR
jgi:hypothetical protein